MRLINVASIERLGQGDQTEPSKVDANTEARNCDEEQISHNSRWRAQ